MNGFENNGAFVELQTFRKGIVTFNKAMPTANKGQQKKL